jgi:hypothetical protein
MVSPMRVGQVIVPGASEYEQKSQRIDLALLAPDHEVVPCDLNTAAAHAVNLVHVYGSAKPGQLRKLTVPYVTELPETRAAAFGLRWLAPAPPPHTALPEAVEEEYFTTSGAAAPADRHVVGTFGRHRHGVANAVEQARTRIERFRDDVTWRLFDKTPTAADLAGVEVWVDPATTESDRDGFVAEAIAAGKAVVASRTAINAQRLERGRTGFLVPPSDPNELVHAILAALFKPEVARLKIEAARQTAGKFRPRQRLRVLKQTYESLLAGSLKK